MKDDSILLSPKHGVNPSVLHCICCGKDYGIAMLGKLKGDEEAPRDMYQGLCKDCEGVVNQGGAMIIEVKDGEEGNNPYRTGRLVGITKECKERNHMTEPIMYMPHSIFEQFFGEVEFK
jgi:hypothetical protein